MPRTVRLQGDSNAHDRPWRVALEQGFFAAEGLEWEPQEDNPKGVAGRVQDFSQRWKESELSQGSLEVYPVCEWGAIERVQQLGGGKIIGLDTTVRTGAIMVRKDTKVQSLADLRNVPIAVTWHAGTFYAAIEVMEAAGVPFDDIRLEHANDRLDALLSGKNQAAALMEPLVSRALDAGCRKIADLRWRGGIVAGNDVDEETAAKLLRALNRAVEWLRENEARSREELLRDLKPEQRRPGDAGIDRRAELSAGRVPGKGRLDAGPRLPQGQPRLQGRGARRMMRCLAIAAGCFAHAASALAQPSFSDLARSNGTPQVPGLSIVYLSPLGDPKLAAWKNVVVHQTEGPAGSAHAMAEAPGRQSDGARRHALGRDRRYGLLVGAGDRHPACTATAPTATTTNTSPTSPHLPQRHPHQLDRRQRVRRQLP